MWKEQNAPHLLFRLDCVRDYVRRVSNSESVDIAQLYYKKNRRRTVIQLNSDADISSLLNEYPLTYKNGKRKMVSTMYLSVVLRKGELYSLGALEFLLFRQSQNQAEGISCPVHESSNHGCFFFSPPI